MRQAITAQEWVSAVTSACAHWHERSQQKRYEPTPPLGIPYVAEALVWMFQALVMWWHIKGTKVSRACQVCGWFARRDYFVLQYPTTQRLRLHILNSEFTENMDIARSTPEVHRA